MEKAAVKEHAVLRRQIDVHLGNELTLDLGRPAMY